MNAAENLLALRPALLRRSVHDRNEVRHPESHLLDFVVDGQSLSDLIPEGQGLATPLNRPWLATVPEAVEQLRGRKPCTDLAPGRVPLLVCGECGDLECGAVTAALDVGQTTTTWADFRWEDGGTPSTSIHVPSERLSFSSRIYLDVVSDAAERVAGLPYDQLANEGRRSRWPWQWGWRGRLRSLVRPDAVVVGVDAGGGADRP
jgi:hypothetical protein